MKPGRVLLAIALSSGLVFATHSVRADTYPRQPGVDVQQYSFRLTLGDTTDVIEGEATVDFRVLQDGLDTLTLDLAQPKPPEVSMLKCYDSVTDGSVSRWSFHSACIDPTAPDDAPCRKNVVVRSFIFF